MQFLGFWDLPRLKAGSFLSGSPPVPALGQEILTCCHDGGRNRQRTASCHLALSQGPSPSFAQKALPTQLTDAHAHLDAH